MKSKLSKVKFASRDSLKLHGTLQMPSAELRGLMLMVHGITSDRHEWGIFDLLGNMLAEEGIASFRFDFRGHGASRLDGDKISLMGILSDVTAAWAEFDGLLGSVAERLPRYGMGSSFGGGLSYAAASRRGGVDRVFLLAPVFDYLADIENCAPKWRDQLKRKNHFKYNDLALGRPLANEALYFDPLSGPPVPATIFHGTKDGDVSIDLSRDVAARHSNIELIEVEGAGHVLNVPDDFDLELERSWEFVRAMAAQVRERVR